MRLFSFALAPLLCGLATTSFAQQETVEDARLTYAYFTCSVFAGMAAKKEKEQHYLELGMAAGRRFFKAKENGLVSESIAKRLPVAVSWNMDEGSTDFSLGKIYSTANQSVRDDFGPFPTDAAGRMLAYTEMVARNCDLLRGDE
ncbi:hypothetical protein ACS3QZ_15920 [Shimia sp. W99]